MINNEDLIRSILWCIENAESAAKAVLSDYEKLDCSRNAIDADMRYNVGNLASCARVILVELNKIHADRVGIESALSDDVDRVIEPDRLFDTCIRIVGDKLRESGFNGEDDSQKERFGDMKYISKLAGLEKEAV